MCASLASILLAASFAAPTLPPSDCDDTEVVTNVAIPVVRADSRLFAFRLGLDATPSNCVSLAFGRDADGDGILSRSEEALLVGWNCGEWKVVDCATGDTYSEPVQTGNAFLDWRLQFSPSAVPNSLSVTASGNAAFAALASHPPQFLFSPMWDTMRVACRGLDAPNPQVDCSVANIPFVLRIR